MRMVKICLYFTLWGLALGLIAVEAISGPASPVVFALVVPLAVRMALAWRTRPAKSAALWMAVHDQVTVKGKTDPGRYEILAVPGGWIYTRIVEWTRPAYGGPETTKVELSSVFVPRP